VGSTVSRYGGIDGGRQLPTPVTNQMDQQSNAFTFIGQSPTNGPRLGISGLNPTNPRVRANPQTFTAEGSEFQGGLSAPANGPGGLISGYVASVGFNS